MNRQAIEQILVLQEAFVQIQYATGKAKETELAKYKDNEIVRKGLDYLLNPLKTYGLTDKKLHKTVSCTPVKLFVSDFFGLLDELNRQPAISDGMIDYVQYWLYEGFGDADYERVHIPFVESLITKSYRLGVTAKTVNKVFGKNFIPIMECMLANKYFEHPNAIKGKEFYITQKLDGIRCLAFVKDGKVTFMSRQGQEIEGLDEIKQDLLTMPYLDDAVYDGELLVDDAFVYGMSGKTDNIVPSGDNYKRTTQIVRKDGPKKGVTYYVFDCVGYDEFFSGSCSQPYWDRRRWVSAMTGGQHAKPLPVLIRSNDPEDILYWLDKMRSLGQEGVMINIADAPYECKRTNNLLKVKVMQDCDLRIIGFEEGKGRNAGTLGAIVVDYKGNELRVGSGYTDHQREWMWEHQDELMGRVVTVQYFEETQDKNGVKSLRFPVFKMLREEGKEPSYE